MLINNKKIIEALGFKDGDLVRINNDIYTLSNGVLKGEGAYKGLHLLQLDNIDVTKVEELTCEMCDCDDCPLRILECYVGDSKLTLKDILKDITNKYNDPEMYDFMIRRIENASKNIRTNK